jgi:hypothetical protein
MAEVKHNQGEAGGYLVGRRHSEGGIKAVNKSTGQPLEMEGGEVVITRNAVSDNTKRSFNGKMMTNREILSTINQSGGGVAFAEGGEVPESIDYVDMVFEYDGQELDSRKILEKMAEGGQVDSILASIESQYLTNGDCAPCGGDLTGTLKYDQGGKIKPESIFIDRIEVFYKDALTSASPDNTGNMLLKVPSIITEFLTKSSDFTQQVTFLVKHEITEIIEKDREVTNEIEVSFTATLDEIIELKHSGLVKAIGDLYITSDRTRNAWFQANKVYFLAVGGGNTVANASTIGYADFTQGVSVESLRMRTELLQNIINQGFRIPTSSDGNFKKFEKLGRELLKKDVRSFAFFENYLIGCAGTTSKETFGFSGVYNAPTGSPLPKDIKNWSWWKNNFFTNRDRGFLAQASNNIAGVFFDFDDIDFASFECDIVVQSRRTTDATQEKVSGYVKASLQDDYSFKGYQNYSKVTGMTLLESNEIIATMTLTSKGRPQWTDVGFQVETTKTILEPEFKLFQYNVFFNSKTSELYHFGRENFIVTKDLEAIKVKRDKEAEEARLERERIKAEQAAAKAAEEALKNRPYKVRDQFTDEQFFPLDAMFDKDADLLVAREAIQKEVASLRTLLKFTTGAKMADERAEIIREITLLERKDAKLGQKMINVVNYPTLLSPQSLLDYYYSQATQNPTVPLGEASGLSTPSGKPSKLPLQAYYAVRTTFFKKWFGDWELAYATKDYNNCSILVDEETGEPRLMFHGVRKKIPGVQMGAMGSGVKRPYGEFNPPNFPATYFTDDFNYVKFYAGQADNQPKPTPNYEGFIYSVFINMRNPVVITDLGLKTSYKELLTNIYLNYGVKVEPSKDLLNKIASDTNADLKTWNYVRYDLNLIESLKRAGYDGIIQIGDVPSFGDNQQMIGMVEGGEYLVFNPEQVKSATVKNSFYVPFIKDIRFKEGGHVRI